MAEWIVRKEEAGARLDQWLTTQGRISRKAAKRALDQGAVRVNGRRVHMAKWEIKAGDRVHLDIRPPGGRARERQTAHTRVEVLYEDQHLIAVVKPSGIIVVPTVDTHEPTLVDQVRTYIQRKFPGARGTYVKAMHRLDKETSGIVLLAKSKVADAVIRQFKNHTIGREYIAMVHGGVDKEAGTINLPLVKGDFGSGRRVSPEQTGEGDGKRAITHYMVVERYPTATWLKIRVDTGRTHQIRVHLASIGHPILGDDRYGLPEGMVDVPRLMLHATVLTFRPPENGEKIELTLPPPEDFAAVIEKLRMSV